MNGKIFVDRCQPKNDPAPNRQNDSKRSKYVIGRRVHLRQSADKISEHDHVDVKRKNQQIEKRECPKDTVATAHNAALTASITTVIIPNVMMLLLLFYRFKRNSPTILSEA